MTGRHAPLEGRFWAKVDRRGPDDCWPWLGTLTVTGGYGTLNSGDGFCGPPITAHRLSAQLAGYEIADRFVLHSCDNRPCVNPAHLRVGTHAENMADMVARGRQARGEGKANQTPLTEADVRVIRQRVEAGESLRNVARDYPVGITTIHRIAHRKRWAHVA